MRRTLSALALTTALCLTALPAQAAGTADVPVTPIAPVVVDECGVGGDSVTIPDIDGVRYLVEISGATIELTPGSYAGVAFWADDAMTEEEYDDLVLGDTEGWTLPDAAATITAEAVDGAVLAEGAPTSFDVALSSTPCAPEHAAVTATSTECGTLTFTNPAGNPDAVVVWGDMDAWEEYAEVTVPAGGSRTVTTDAQEVDWFAVDATTWKDEEWADPFEGATARATTVPDYVATQEDRDLLAETAQMFDDLLDEGLGQGLTQVEQDCEPAPVEEPTTTPTPEIPAVVQTDGVAQPSPVAPLALGGLTALAALLVLRPRRQR